MAREAQVEYRRSNCYYLDWYCNCKMICDIRGNYHFDIMILIFLDKRIKIIMGEYFHGPMVKLKKSFLKSVE